MKLPPSLRLSPLLLAALVAHGRAEEPLTLSEDVTPWTELGKGFTQRPEPLAELIEDELFKTNRDRKELIAMRNETGENVDVPKRETLFGRNPFLGPGVISPGFISPTGEVWQPYVMIYGDLRTAVQTFDNGVSRSSDWSSRLDLFTNFYLTPTERINLGLRPFDKNDNFVGCQFGGNTGKKGPVDPFNGNISSLYFEGDFGELFPRLDPQDTKSLDYGFAVGRMPLSIEDGVMINDASIDGIGITRSSLFL